jgi:2-phospho-L-lactate guanylyltransferase
LRDVLEAVRGANRSPTVLATGPLAIDDVPVVVDERPLTTAVNDALADAEEPCAVVMADLPLATPNAIERLFAAVDGADVVLVPGRGGGTNALVSTAPRFRVDYHGCSYRDHRTVAADIGATVATVDSFRLSTDIDEPGDLVEVLLHTEGHAADWLRGAGVEIAVEDGRASVRRE